MRERPVSHSLAWGVGAIVLGVSLAACGSSASSPPTTTEPAVTVPASTVDYSQASTWLNLPKSTPYPVDVFYLSDTGYTMPTPSSPPIGPIDAPSMIQSDTAVYQRTATAFETVANIYAPYYEQVAVSAQNSMSDAQQIATVGGTPTTDCIAAFEYYLAHYNHGRPFILAGHSQGSSVLTHLLSDYMPSHPDVYKRMIAAYVIGYPITTSYMAHNPILKFATGASDTGVIISYNTEAPSMTGVNPVMLGAQHALVINPLSWSTDTAEVPASASLGSWMPNASGQLVKVPAFADAQIDTAKGVLICSSAPEAQLEPGTAQVPAGIYHSYDYPFYYFNIRANAANRISHFMAAHPADRTS
jgi:hypothetical protein